MARKFNEEQTIVYETIINCVENQNSNENEPKLFFIFGAGGTGKTFLYNTIIDKVRSLGKCVISMASSGVAALLLNHGRTAHSSLKIPLKVNSTSLCNIPPKSLLADQIRQTSIYIWDEAPLMNKDVFESVDRSLRDIMGMNSPELEIVAFGGKIFIFGGDFRQLLPVISRASRATIVSMCINRSTFRRMFIF